MKKIRIKQVALEELNEAGQIIKRIFRKPPKPPKKKIIAVYGGRFQPYGPHHHKTYKLLDKYFDDVYITTSNIKRPPKHPLNFEEKVEHMTKMGVPKNRIIHEKTPYRAENLQSKFDPNTTSFVYVFGAKDKHRLVGGKYFRELPKDKSKLVGFDKHAYIKTAPHIAMKHGGKEINGTLLRQLLGDPKTDTIVKKRIFVEMFGYYDDNLFRMLTDSFGMIFGR